MVALLHAAAIAAFARALLVATAVPDATALQVNIVAAPPRPASPPLRPLHALPLAAMNRPLAALVIPAVAIRTAVSAPPAPAAAGGAAPATGRSPALPDTPMKFVSGPTDPQAYYPFAARLAHQQGSALIRVCVDAAGIISDVKVLTTSGIYLLDQAALVMARKSVWKAGTTAGKPIPGCAGLNIHFSLVGSVRF
jgi:TonB family protein